MKSLTLTAVVLAGIMMIGCGEEPPEPEVSAGYEQPTTPPTYATNEPATGQSAQPSIDDVEKITVDELVRLQQTGNVTVIDVRSSQYYLESHIPGAINIPASQTAAMIDMIPKGKKIVTYCT